MKIVVIGATGLTGKLAVQQLLLQGHEVTAFARNPADVTPAHASLRTVKGDARDLASLEAAVAGQDAVLAAFGPRSLSKDDLQEVFDRNLVAAMKKVGVKASLDPAGLKPKMTRADLATFMIEQLTSDTWVRKSPLIGY